MLRSLYIKDYALIEELDIEFGSGLNILTGETGAGKSIIVGALGMILGDRASTDALRSGAKKAIIEGIFDEANTDSIRTLLADHEIDTEPLPRIILRRQLTDYGSRAFINDTPATLDVMRAVAAELIDLHGQHEHQSLLDRSTHRTLLDGFGGLSGLVEHYQRQYESVQELVDERTRLAERKRELNQQRELYEFQIEEIDEVDPQPGEEEELKSERRVLENAEQLYACTSRLYDMLYTDEHAVHDQIVVARNELQDLARIDDTFSEQVDEVKSAQIIINELASFLQDYNAHVEFDPDRLQAIRERLADIERLKRKYGGTLDAVLEHREEIGERYALASDFSGTLERLDTQIAEAQATLSDAAERLSTKRREVAERVERAAEREMATLGMPDSQFNVHFERTPDSEGWVELEDTRYAARPHGIDRVEFFISTNVGEPPKPLTDVASGGEISRIMLALKTILAKSERLPILVFDEIDAGISGDMARRVGESMHNLARYHQIITITHLPQIAALGDVHFRVSKTVADDRTHTTIHRLDGEEQAEQVATLISGADVTDAALTSARELMNVADQSES